MHDVTPRVVPSAVKICMYPDYKQDAQAFFNGDKACFCNMFIMISSPVLSSSARRSFHPAFSLNF